MKKLSHKKVMLLVAVIFFLLLVSGCQNNVDPTTHRTLDEKIIYLTTGWGEMWKNEGLFTSLIVYPLAQCINLLSQYAGVVGGIALTTILVNALTFGASRKSSVDMQKIQALQPEMQRIQQKYEGRNDDAAKMQQAQELQNLYTKHKVNPLGSMITPFLQLPIMMAMYYAVQRANAVVVGDIMGAPLYKTPMDGIREAMPVLFVIFILMGVAQFASSKIPTYLAEKRAKEKMKKKSYDKNQKNPSNNMMIYGMLVMILVLAINWPTAMSLYWLVSSLVNVVKTIYIQKRYVDNEAV